jgi:two-component system cell cycle response regulator DivK
LPAQDFFTELKSLLPEKGVKEPLVLEYAPEACISMESNATILYVEDNADNRLLIRRILQAEGFNMLEAPNAAQALQVVQDQPPDLILMDISMPDVDGYTLTARFKKMPELKAVPVIALTANVMRGDRERSLEAGCDGYIQKPIDIDNLVYQVNHFLAEKG